MPHTLAQTRPELAPSPPAPACLGAGLISPLETGSACLPEALPRRQLIETTVAEVFGVHTLELPGLSRGRAPVAKARHVAMYLTHIVFGLSLSDTGKLFKRDRTTVAHACPVVEDLRDDPLFDRILELLESVMPALVLPRATPAHN